MIDSVNWATLPVTDSHQGVPALSSSASAVNVVLGLRTVKAVVGAPKQGEVSRGQRCGYCGHTRLQMRLIGRPYARPTNPV